MLERRRLKRRSLIYYLRVFDLDTGRELGHLVDITTDGILVMSETPIGIGRTFRLAMRLPSTDGVAEHAEFEAESIRSGRDVNHDFTDTAFRIVRLEPRHRGLIETLIDDYGFRD